MVAAISNLRLTLARNIANVTITIDYDIVFSDFDRRTNLQYMESWRLIGDDTNQDGDDGPIGDDPVLGVGALSSLVTSNGLTTLHRSRTRTEAWTTLDEDAGLPAPANDDEIRAVVTLTPQLPTAGRFESAAQLISAP
jgi:hypothetical protein